MAIHFSSLPFLFLSFLFFSFFSLLLPGNHFFSLPSPSSSSASSSPSSVPCLHRRHPSIFFPTQIVDQLPNRQQPLKLLERRSDLRRCDLWKRCEWKSKLWEKK